MRDIEYAIEGFLTVRRDSLRVPLRGALTIHAGPASDRFTGELVLDQASVGRTVAGASLLRADVQIEAESPVTGRVDDEGRMLVTVTVDAVLTTVRAAGFTLIGGGSCRTAAHAVVPLRSQPGFDLERGGRVTGSYNRPPFTGCGQLTPLVNLLMAGYGNTVVIDLTPRAALPGCPAVSPAR